jgi:hypothetical protein
VATNGGTALQALRQRRPKCSLAGGGAPPRRLKARHGRQRRLTKAAHRVGDDGYSHGELVTAQEKIIGDFSYFGYFANRPLCCVTISFKPKVLVSPKIFQILWLAVGLTKNNKQNNKRAFGIVGITVLLFAAV